jgi:flagellar biosynthesis anti-sigma factor FlgM
MIPPLQPTTINTEAGAGSAGSSSALQPAGGTAPAASTTTGAGEEVTVSADAATTTQLLDAARGADGVNHGAVQQVRSAIQSGTYQVSPSALAKSISGALRESSM